MRGAKEGERGDRGGDGGGDGGGSDENQALCASHTYTRSHGPCDELVRGVRRARRTVIDGAAPQYIAVRALAEPIRCMCRYAGLVIEDETFAVPAFVDKTREEKRAYTPTEQLPAIHVTPDEGGAATVISQSGAVMRYLAATIGGSMYPTDPLARARADVVFETAQVRASTRARAPRRPARCARARSRARRSRRRLPPRRRRCSCSTPSATCSRATRWRYVRLFASPRAPSGRDPSCESKRWIRLD